MAEKPKPKSSKSQPTVMDVARPGKSAPSASSRPVIVGHGPMAKDPMVNKAESVKENDKASVSGEEQITVNLTKKKVIAPLQGGEEPIEEAADTSGSESEMPAESSVPAESESVTDDEENSEGQVQEEAETTTVEDNSSAESTEESSSDTSEDAKNAAMVDTVVEQVEKAKKEKGENDKDDKSAELLKKRQEELDKLIEERKYYVPIAQETKKKRRMGLILSLLLLLAAVGAYLALDAQLIKNNINLPIEFFKEQEETDNSANDLPAPNNNQTNNKDEPQTEANKSYIDSAKIFALQYPADWKVELEKWGEGTDGPQPPEPDWTKETQSFQIIPATGHKENNVRVTGGCTTLDGEGNSVKLIDYLKANKDQFHTQEDKTINGYKAFYDKTDFKNESFESYVEHQYVITKDENCVSLLYRENHHHDMGSTNYDDNENMPEFEAIVNSIKFLK